MANFDKRDKESYEAKICQKIAVIFALNSWLLEELFNLSHLK